MYFRPFPVLTVLAIPALAALVTLGVWQSQRAGWKADEIAAFAERASAQPQPVDQVCLDGLVPGEIVAPPQATGPAIRVFGHAASGAAGWRRFQAATLCNQDVLVQTGFEPLQIGGPGAALPASPEVRPDRFIIAPWPERPFMAAPNAPERNEWHWFDGPAIAAAAGLKSLDTRVLVAPLEGTPDYLVRTPPETHIGYAVTWFGMAIAFVVIYGLMHMRAGRLRMGKASDGKAEE